MWTNAHVLVTGAASGIGRALAAAFIARGARVSAADINADAMHAVAAELGATALVCDVSDRAQIDRMIADAAAAHGPIDLICSNAGIGRNKLLMKTTNANLDQLFNANFRSALFVAQAYQAHLLASGTRGRVMFTASENSLSIPAAVVDLNLGAYAATKHALLILVEWLREELKGGPLTPALLFPGPVLSEPFRAAIETGRFGEGMDPARKAAFLSQLISTETCAERAIIGLERGLFYIPTHAHIQDDAHTRMRALDEAFAAMKDVLG